jgi:NADPH-dependent glutamate synthase beta subunit-like oxidoreductase
MRNNSGQLLIIPLLAGNDWVLAEADRCLSCFEPPCQQNCPARIPVLEFIRSIKSGNLKYAARLVREANPLAAVCGEVCPEEVFCQSKCTRMQIDSPVKIRELHHYATRHETDYLPDSAKLKGNVAIIGSGPAGISCAFQLVRIGAKAVVFERSKHAGGVPSSSIPDFRLAEDVINEDIDYARRAGVEIILNRHIDMPSKLLDDFDAVFIAAGLSLNKKTNIAGSDSKQVIDALPFLEDMRSGKTSIAAGKRIVVIGGGNVSLDVAAAAMAAGASEVHLLYRRGPREMKIWKSELDEAQKRGVIIDFLVTPVEYIIESNNLIAVKCIRTWLTDKLDSSMRRIAEPIANTEFLIPADLAIEAIGLVSDYSEDIPVNDDLTTSVEGVFAGGDWARGEGTIVEAVRDGKLAAEKIAAYMKDKNV